MEKIIFFVDVAGAFVHIVYMKATAENLKTLEIKMNRLWSNQALRHGARLAWESPRFRQYQAQWEKMTAELGGVDYTIGDVLA